MNRLLHSTVAATFIALFSVPSSANVMLGAHVGSEKDPNAQANFIALEKAIGHKLAIDNDMEDWNDFPHVDRIKWDIQNGRLPMLTWRIVFDRGHTDTGCATGDAILAGTYDTQIAAQAAKLKAFNTPILVRYNHEMADNEENTCFNGSPVKADIAKSGARYIAAWKHIVDIFRKVGATNVKWVWAPGQPTYVKNIHKAFYPGDDYVDWIAIDYYNKLDEPLAFGTTKGGIQNFLAMASHGKPLMFAENGAVNDPKLTPDGQTQWLKSVAPFFKAHPAIKAFCYWDASGVYEKEHPNYGCSGYVLQGPGLAAFKALADDPYFQPPFSKP